MRLFFQPEIHNGALYLDEQESRHCIKVLRLKEKDQIIVLDGKGSEYTAAIVEANYKKCRFNIISQKSTPKPTYHIHIAIAPTKSIERIEWFVEKAVELGVQEISFILCDNSERKHFKTDRVYKKAVSAMKQSKDMYLPIINELISIDHIINNTNSTERYIAYVDDTNHNMLPSIANSNQDTLTLIGPEGGFTSKELNLALSKGFTKVSLGNKRLRTETAGIATAHILNLINQR